MTDSEADLFLAVIAKLRAVGEGLASTLATQQRLLTGAVNILDAAERALHDRPRPESPSDPAPGA